MYIQFLQSVYTQYNNIIVCPFYFYTMYYVYFSTIPSHLKAHHLAGEVNYKMKDYEQALQVSACYSESQYIHIVTCLFLTRYHIACKHTISRRYMIGYFEFISTYVRIIVLYMHIIHSVYYAATS